MNEPCASRRARSSSLAARLIPALAALWLAGCPGRNDPAPTTHVLSGTISGPGAAGATVVLSGAASASVQADETGWYAFGGLRDGDYAVAPSRTGYTFAPASRPVTMAGDSVDGQDFTAAAVGGHAIGGKISGAAAASVTLALTGTGVVTATATTADDGTYRFDGYPDGDYTITPSLAGYLFSPGSRAVTVAAGDVAGADFSVAAAGATATVDRVEPPASAAAIGGASVPIGVVLTNWTSSGLGDIAVQTWVEQGEARRRASWAAVTDPCAPSGVPGVLLPGTCTLGVSVHAGNANPGTGTLAPGSATLAVELVQGAASTVLHTLRVPITLVPSRIISGRISGAVAVSLSAVAAADGRSWGLDTGGAGTYSFAGLPVDSYTITPSKQGYKFSPASRTVDVSAADATGVDFSAAPSSAVFTLDRLDLDAPTATIGGAWNDYTAILTNWTASPISAVIQNWVEQGSARRAAGGGTFDEAPGTRAERYGFIVFNSAAGTGTLVPGSAELVVEVTFPGYVAQIYRYPITLQ